MNRILCLAAACLMSAALHAQSAPDLGGKGVWYPRRVRDMASARWKSGGSAEKSADRDIDVPFLPWAKDAFEANRTGKHEDSASRCLPLGIPRSLFTAEPFEIVQQPNRILFIYEAGAHVWRNVWMDGRAHPKDPNPSWLGDSIGHWEGATLVVDAVGFNDKTWLDDAGHPHTEQLHVTERYTRISPSALKYEVTIDDPGAYSKSWSNSVTIPFHRGEALQEYMCQEGEHDARASAARK